MQAKQQNEFKCADCGKVCGNGGALGNHKLRCPMKKGSRHEEKKHDDMPYGYTEVDKVDLKQGDVFIERSSLSDDEKTRIRDIKKTLSALLSAPVQICNKLPSVSDAFEITLSRQSADTTAEFTLTAESDKEGEYTKSKTFLEVSKAVRFVESLMVALNPWEDVNEKVTVTMISDDTVTISRSDGPSELNLDEYGLTWKAVRSDSEGDEPPVPSSAARNMPSKGDFVLLGDDDEDSGFSSESYKVVNVKRSTFDVQVGERRTVNVHVVNDTWKPCGRFQHSEREQPSSSKSVMTKTGLFSTDSKDISLSNAAEIVDAAITTVASLDADMAKERVEYVRERRTELDAKIDAIHISDEDAHTIAIQNDATARKEAREKFPSNELAERIKSALSKYESNLSAMQESLQLLQQLIDSTSSTKKRPRPN